MDKFNVDRRTVELEGSYNIRDLGGLPTRDGGTIRPGRFLRSGSLHELTEQGRQALLDTGVRTVIDLRSRVEREQKPDPVENDPVIAWHHVPMLDYINSSVVAGEMTFPDSLETMYFGLLDHAGHSLAQVLTLFAEAPRAGFLFHCTAGKDRTGMVAMLLLALAGVEDSSIIADYSASAARVPPFPGGRPHFVPEYALTSPPETMQTTLDYLNARHGGIQSYLSSIGVTPHQQAVLRSGLLED